MTQTTAPEPLAGLQGEGGDCRDQGRADDCPASGSVRRPPEPDHDVEGAARRRSGRRVRARHRHAPAAAPPVDVKAAARQDRRADAGERFFRGSAQQGGIAERKAMIDRDHELSVTRQAEAVGIARSTVYYLPRAVSAADLDLMQQIDRLHTEFPFAGSRMLRGLLAANGSKVGRRHVKTLMQRMGIEALYRRPRTTKPEPGHKIYPVSAAWHRGHAAEPGVGDGHHVYPDGARLRLSRRRARLVLAARSVVAGVDHDGSVVLRRDAGGRADASTASQRSSTPIRASSSPCTAFTGVLAANDIRISMDGKGAWRDNVFVERLWRSVKYEEVYLHAYDNVSDAQAGIGRYLDLYNRRRPHSSLDGMTPDRAYFGPHSMPADPLGSLTPAEAPLIKAEKLSEQAGPPHSPPAPNRKCE